MKKNRRYPMEEMTHDLGCRYKKKHRMFDNSIVVFDLCYCNILYV